MEKRNKTEWKEGIRDGIPIALGYVAVSFTFGLAAVEKNLSVWQAVLIATTCVTSAGQFAGLDVIAAGGTLAELLLIQLVINLRYMLMSFSLSQKIGPDVGNGRRSLMAFGVTDEIFGVSAARKGRLNPVYTYGVMAVAIPGWILGTLLGAVSGNILPAFLMSCLSVAIYGMFMAIIIPKSRDDRAVGVAVLAAMALACLFTYMPGLRRISAGFRIILITVAVSAATAVLKPVPGEEEEV